MNADHDGQRWGLLVQPPGCDGNVCVDCCRCDKCGRRVGTRHLDACACPPDGQHFYCVDCNAHRVAVIFAPYESEAVVAEWVARRDALPDLPVPEGTDA